MLGNIMEVKKPTPTKHIEEMKTTGVKTATNKQVKQLKEYKIKALGVGK